MSCISMGSETPVLPVHALSIKLDGITPFISPMLSESLHEGVIYRHIILTVPAMFRPTFYQNAAVLLSAFMRCGGQCLDDFYSTVRGKALRGGSITVLHMHGRNGQYHPHLHLLATSGGYDAQGSRWEHLQYLPYDLLIMCCRQFAARSLSIGFGPYTAGEPDPGGRADEGRGRTRRPPDQSANWVQSARGRLSA